ncbi:MAG: hypothetical protein ACRDXX_19000 [Stackebrandtia sp.]
MTNTSHIAEKGSARTQSRRRAREITRQRREELLQRERRVEETLAVFWEHRLRGAQIRQTAARRAERIVAAGDAKAAEHGRSAAEAVAELSRLGESRYAIGETTGLSPGEVRAALAEAAEGSARPDAGVTATVDVASDEPELNVAGLGGQAYGHGEE